jgi:mRNA interferase HicA
MKRTELLKYLQAQGCEFIREGSRHSWQNKRSSVPRHTEVENDLVRKICKDLGIEPIK